MAATGAFLIRRLTKLRRFAAARRASLAEIDLRGGSSSASTGRALALTARARRRAGISPIASASRPPPSSSNS